MLHQIHLLRQELTLLRNNVIDNVSLQPDEEKDGITLKSKENAYINSIIEKQAKLRDLEEEYSQLSDNGIVSEKLENTLNLGISGYFMVLSSRYKNK